MERYDAAQRHLAAFRYGNEWVSGCLKASLAFGRMLTMPKKQDSRNSRPAQRRQHGGCRKTEKQKGAFGDALLSCLCGVQPRVVDFDPPLCSPEEFRAMHYRKHVKGQQASHQVYERPMCSPSSRLKALRAKKKIGTSPQRELREH